MNKQVFCDILSILKTMRKEYDYFKEEQEKKRSSGVDIDIAVAKLSVLVGEENLERCDDIKLNSCHIYNDICLNILPELLNRKFGSLTYNDFFVSIVQMLKVAKYRVSPPLEANKHIVVDEYLKLSEKDKQKYINYYTKCIDGLESLLRGNFYITKIESNKLYGVWFRYKIDNKGSLIVYYSVYEDGLEINEKLLNINLLEKKVSYTKVIISFAGIDRNWFNESFHLKISRVFRYAFIRKEKHIERKENLRGIKRKLPHIRLDFLL